MVETRINDIGVKEGVEVDDITISSNQQPEEAAPMVTTPDKQSRPKAPQRKKTGPAYLSQDELDRLWKAIDSPRDRAIFRVAYHAGLRVSEVGMLELRDLDTRTDRLMITRLKGSRSGIHHMCREEARALRAWLKIRGDEPGPIFMSQMGRPISRQMLDVLIKDYGRKAKIPPALRHFHVLKHTCATHLLAKGHNVEQVQDWIGHANIQNTMIYSHITNARRDEMARSLRDW